MKPYEVIAREEIYQGRIINVVKDEIKFPNGLESVREVVLHEDAASVVAMDDDGKILFVRQYRHPVDAMILELPAGLVDAGEKPHECALRELEEETSFRCEELTLLTTVYTSPGFCTERIFIYAAENLLSGQQSLDEDEYLEVEKYTLEEAIAKIFSGEITDAKTIAGVFAYKESKLKEK